MQSDEFSDAGGPRQGGSLKRALIAVGSVALVTIGLAVIIYVGIVRNRVVPTPTPFNRTSPSVNSTLQAQTTGQALAQAVGQVKEYSPGALIAIIKPASGNIEQIIITADTQVTDDSGKPVPLSTLKPGVTITSTGILDPLGRLIAQTIRVAKAASIRTSTPTPAISKTPSRAPAEVTNTPEPSEVPAGFWHGTYFSNRDLEGAPAFVRDDPVIDFQWGDGSPAPGVPIDAFSVRWEGRWNFDTGGFRFSAFSDDGVRVWVDGVLVIDQWKEQAPALASADLYLQAGEHAIKVEYFDGAGGAEVRVWWDFRGQYPEWKAEYYPNPNLTGAPALERNDENLLFDWGQSAPAPQIPVDHFSVRWTRTMVFDEGPYRFSVIVDDGVRLWVDGILVIDEWHVMTQTAYAGYAYLTSGAHILKVEYFEHTGAALIKLGWDRQEAYNDWKGEYFANADLSGNPAFIRDDQAIAFDWGTGSPVPNIPSDNFSIRWTRSISFAAGTYRFWATADDGVRILVDGTRIVDAWRNSAGNVETVISLADGNHTIVVEYFEHGGAALIRFGWDLTGTATPTFTPEPSITPTFAPSPTVTPAPVETATPDATSMPTPSLTPSPSP
ncbi:MAG: PA14 domain-containing protein [Anaerolineae bacterium]